MSTSLASWSPTEAGSVATMDILHPLIISSSPLPYLPPCSAIWHEKQWWWLTSQFRFQTPLATMCSVTDGFHASSLLLTPFHSLSMFALCPQKLSCVDCITWAHCSLGFHQWEALARDGCAEETEFGVLPCSGLCFLIFWQWLIPSKTIDSVSAAWS